MRWTVPNILTVMRLLAAPGVALAFALFDRPYADWIAFILLREVFVSGLREFLGAKAGKLKVTYLAKWKTTAQMVAIPVLLLAGVFEWDRRHGEFWISNWFHDWAGWVLSNGGLVLIWVAGILTLLTGYDYLVKAMPFLRDRKR